MGHSAPSCELNDALTASLQSPLGWQKKRPARAINSIVVAVSGGPDSFALAHATAVFAKQNGYAYQCVVVNHNIRPEADEEAELVLAELAHHHLSATIIKITDPPPSQGIQEWARQRRYAVLLDFCHQHDACLLLGHHADDQAETVLMRLAKGSAVDGLAGMQKVTWKQDICCIRPFLHLQKSALTAYCAAHKIDYVKDRSNEDKRFARVRMRQFLARQDGSKYSTYGLRLSRAMGTISAYHRDQLSQWMMRHATIQLGLQIRLDRHAFDRLPEAAQHYLLRQCVKGVGNAYYLAGFEQIAAILGKLNKRTAATCGGCYLYASPSAYHIQPEWGRAAPGLSPIASGQTISFDNRWRISASHQGQIMRYGQLVRNRPEQVSLISESLSVYPLRVREMIPCWVGLDGRVLAPHFSIGMEKASIYSRQNEYYLVAWPLDFPPLLQNMLLDESSSVNEGMDT